MMNGCCDNVFNLLTEPVHLNDLKREFLLFIALSNDGESQAFLGEVVFGDANLEEPLLPGETQLIHIGCIGKH